MTKTRRVRDDPPPVATGATANALRFLMDAGHGGSLVTRSLVARIGDPDLAANFPIVIMAELYLNGPRRPVDLQGVVGLTSGGMTKLLDRLEGAAVIQRSHGRVPADRRAIEVSLTPRGIEVAEAMADVVIEGAAEIASIFGRLADDAQRLEPRTPPDRGSRSR